MNFYTHPQRKNFKYESLTFQEGFATLEISNNKGDLLLRLEMEQDGSGYTRLNDFKTPLLPLEKSIIKKELDMYEMEDEFAFQLGEIQKRLKQVYKQDQEVAPSEEAQPEAIEWPESEPKKEPKKETKTVKVTIERPEPVGLEGQLQQIVFDTLESDFTTKTLQNKMIELGIEPNRTEISVKVPGNDPVVVGTQHKDFTKILQVISAKVNLALVGPAGSGKTTTVKKVAEALSLPFYSKSVSAQTGTHEFFGYQDANGNYVRTLFREAYENGGVFLLDEFDAGNPNVLASMNQATANGECAFADGMIKKHEDFIIVMAGNTFGHGATSEYVGRNPIDKATLDRFAFLFFDYDEKFERDLATNKDWCKEVQRIRANVAAKKVKAIVSPRATSTEVS